MIQSKMVEKLISTIIILMLSLAILSPLMVSVVRAAEFEAGADPNFVAASVTSLDGLTSTFSSASESDYSYVSHVFTVADVIFFGYVDGTMLTLYDSSGTLVWNNGGNPLNKGGHAHVAVPQGVYTACGSEKFAVLTGDPITRYVLGYYAMDQNGYGASTELYTWVPQLYGHCSFVVFAYEDNTQVAVDETDTGANVATVTLNKGQHWQTQTLQRKWLHITANHPVSALTCYDQGYLVPSANGRWSGTEFYTYVSDIQSWPEDLTVVSYSDDTLITIKDSNTGSLVWSGEVDEGQAHVESFPSGANRFFTITSSKSVTVAVQPWVAQTSSYHQGLYIGDSTGTRLGTDLIGSTLNGGYLHILAYKDNTNVVVYNSRTGEFVRSYALNDGDYVDANPGNGLWRIMSNYPVSAYSGWGQWNAEFAPVEFREVTPVRVDISTEKECYAAGDCIDLRVKVTDADGNPLYPLKKDDFKISVDGSAAEECDERVEDSIDWALDWADGSPYPPGGSHADEMYVGWCLAFVQDAYQYGADATIQRYGYAKQAADALGAQNNEGVPPRGSFVFYNWYGTIDGEYQNWGHVGLSLGGGQMVHAWTTGPVVAAYDGVGLEYIGWAWPPTAPPIAFERISAMDYNINIKAPETVGTHSITVTATVVTGKGTSTTEIKVYAIEGVSLTVGGNRLTQYENSGDTPIYYRGDSNIYPVFHIDVDVNGASLLEIRNNIWVYVDIRDDEDVKDEIRIKAVYDTITSEFKAHWKNSPDSHPVGKYDTTAEVEDSNSMLLTSSEDKHFYLVFKPPVGYEGLVNGGTSKYNQFDVRLWKPVLETITGEIHVGSAAKELLLFAHGIDGSYYGYWHIMMDETKSFEEIYGFPDPTHEHGGYIYGDAGLSENYDAYSPEKGFAEPWPCPRKHVEIQNAWWDNMVDFIESDFDPEGKADHRRPVGLCDDYATLFVSNARSAGIPARETVGYFREPTLYFIPSAGHEWCEIFDGSEWVHCEPTWCVVDSLYDGVRTLYDAPDVYTNEKGYYGFYVSGIPSMPEKYLYRVAITVEFDTEDYDYGDVVTADISVKNVGSFDIKRCLYLNILDKPTIARLGLTSSIADIAVGQLSVGETRAYIIEYQLPDFGILNGFYETIGDRHLVVSPHFEGTVISKFACFQYKDADITFCEAEFEVPGLCPEWNPQITVDGLMVPLDSATLTSLDFNATASLMTEAFVKPENLSVIAEHGTKHYDGYVREGWYVFNPDIDAHAYTLTRPLLCLGDAVYVPGYGSVMSNQTINITTDYFVVYNATAGTNGFVDIYLFSKNVTLKDIMIFDGVAEIIATQNCTLVSESGISYLSYLSTRDGNGKSFDEICGSFAQEIIINGDTLTQVSIEGEQTQISYYEVGDTVNITIDISNNGIMPETRDLIFTLTEPGVLENGDPAQNAIYNSTKTVIIPAESKATVTFEYHVPLDAQTGKYEIILCNKIAKAVTIFVVQAPFDVTFDVLSSVAQAQQFHINATISNALAIALSGINVTVDLPNDFHTSESLTRDVGTLLSGEGVHVSWLVTATDFEYGSATVKLYISSAEGAQTTASTSLTVLRSPEIRIFTTAPSEVRPSTPFEFAVHVANQGDLVLQNVSLSLQLPDGVTAPDSLTVPIGDLAPWETKSLSWTITSTLDYDFWITANASDITAVHGALATELVNVVKPEIELSVANPVEVILNQECPLTAEVRNIGELAATDVEVSLTLPPELTTPDPVEITVAYLPPGQTEVIAWTIQGTNPGYAEITVTASPSNVSVTRGIIVSHFPLSVKTDKETYLSGDNVIVTTTTTNENPEVSYVDLSVNVTICGPSLQDSYSMPIDFISSLETRNFALTWDSTGRPFGSYIVTAKLQENTIVLNETTTSFTLTTEDDLPPTTFLTVGEPRYLDLVGNAYVSSATPFTLTADDNVGGSGVAGAAYRVFSCDHADYDTGWINATSPTNFSLVGVEDGRYRIAFYSWDNAGNTETIQVVTVFVDNSAPMTSLTITDPVHTDLHLNVTYVTPTSALRLDATDRASGFSSTCYRIANTTYDSGWLNYTGSFCLDGLTNGNYTLSYTSTDNVGNAEATRTLQLVLVRAPDCPGDVTGDGRCDIFDLVCIASCYRLTAADDGWNPIYDLTPDAVINIFDLVTCASRYSS